MRRSKPPASESANGLADEQPEHRITRETQSLKYCDFASAFANRHRHGVGRNQQRGENYRRANAQDESLHIAQHGDEFQAEGFFALGFSRFRGVAKQVVNRRCDLAHIVGRIGQNSKSAGFSFEERNGFFYIFRIEIDRLIVRLRVKYAANVQFEVDGINVTLQNDAVSEFPAVFLGERIVDDYALAIMLPVFSTLNKRS